MRCAIYARYSSDAQNARSLTDQVRECQRFADHKGWLIIPQHIYQDAAISGANVNRVAYFQLKQAARIGEFDCIWADDLSRLGRDMAESAQIFKELSEIGVRIVSVSDGIDTSSPSAKIPFYFKGIMNEMFLDDLKAKIVRGLKGQVTRGYSAGGKVYGYKTRQILDPTGATDKFGRPKRLGCEVVIDKQQAKIILKIFQMKRSGFGCRAIAEYLNKNEAPLPHSGCGGRSGYWGRSTISSILNQRKYLGDWTWNKTKWLNKTRGTKRIKQNRPESEWVVYQNQNLCIISDDLWNAVHNMSAKREQVHRGPRGQYVLSGVLKCADCGSSLVVQNSGRYSCFICNGYRNGGTAVCACNHRISRHVMERAFFDKLKSVLMNPRTLKTLKQSVEKAIRVGLANHKDSASQLKARKKALTIQLENPIRFVEAGDDSTSVRQRIAERESELRSIEVKLRKHSGCSGDELRITVDWLESKLGQLAGLLTTHKEYVGLLNQEIRNLFPDGLRAVQRDTREGVVFQINGTAKPFSSAFLPVSLMSHSGAGTRTPDTRIMIPLL
jgi:site-specific DNA recombinase